MRPVLGLALCATAGCSLVLHDTPPSGATAERFVPCDESNGWPIVDTAIAAVMAVNAALCARDQPCDNESGAGKTGAIIGLAALAGIYGYSAFRGYRGAARCRDLHVDFAARPGPAPGDEGQDCRPDGGCGPGLVCASGLCVRAPEE